MIPIDAISKIVMNGIRATCEPVGIDIHEEKLLKEKEAIRTQKIYPFFRPVVGSHLSGKGNADKRRQFRMGLDAKEKEERAKSQQGKRKKITCETIMADGFVDVQNDE